MMKGQPVAASLLEKGGRAGRGSPNAKELRQKLAESSTLEDLISSDSKRTYLCLLLYM